MNSHKDKQRSALGRLSLLTLPVIFLAGCSSGVTTEYGSPETSNPTPREIREITECERSMYTAAEEPNSTKAEVFIKQTAYNCGGAAEWYAALRQYPQALGFNNVQGDELDIICHKWKKAPVCKNP